MHKANQKLSNSLYSQPVKSISTIDTYVQAKWCGACGDTWACCPDMVVGGSQQETLGLGFVLFGTRQHGLPIILRELVLPDRFDPVSPSFTVTDVNPNYFHL
ncbi:unnamed protein product [Schistosoma curassoni]|uniref:Peptidase A1 domain-containing protein n=1 Tax=Schistosoma curassoni TaxID=6186 RepID=A0A183L3M4_9TREM|nr:unnamed protein product [Schistosoma curassoni]